MGRKDRRRVIVGSLFLSDLGDRGVLLRLPLHCDTKNTHGPSVRGTEKGIWQRRVSQAPLQTHTDAIRQQGGDLRETQSGGCFPSRLQVSPKSLS